MIRTTATDLSTGSRLTFSQNEFDLICSDLASFPISRAAAASSAVPLVTSPVTINNYGGTCGYEMPYWARQFEDPQNRLRPAGRAVQRIKEMKAFQDGGNRPYLHLVDGGLADNLGVRGILESLEELEASRVLRQSVRVSRIERMVVIVVNSLSVPKSDWDRSAKPPNDLQILLKATGTPIDRYSYEGVELLRDTVARWSAMRALNDAGGFANANNPALALAGGDGRGIVTADVSLKREAETGRDVQALRLSSTARCRAIEGVGLHEGKLDQVEAGRPGPLDGARYTPGVELAGEHQRVATDHRWHPDATSCYPTPP